MVYAYDTAPAACQTGETFAEGRLSSMTDASGGTAYCYDRFGDLVRKVQTVNGTALTVRYAYTAAGRLSAVTYPDGMVVDYTRNALGQVTEVGVAPEGGRQVLLTGATYAPFGPATGWTYGNGRSLTRPLDQDYRPVAIQDTAAGGLSLGFGFDAVGNLDKLTSADNAAPLVKFGYDALSRLTAFKDGPTNTVIDAYAYDKTGNRMSYTVRREVIVGQNPDGTGGTPTVQLSTETYTYPSGSHRLQAVASEPRGYDPAGNLIALGSASLPAGVRKTFVYGPDGRMRQVQGPSTAVLADYRYNAKGERVRKSVDLTEAYTVYDEAGHWLGDYNANGTPVQQVVWLDDLPVGVVPGIVLGGGGEYEDPDPGYEPPCFPNCGAERGTASTQGVLHYIEPDHLGTPRVVIEPTRNVSVWSWDLKGEAFGDTAPNENPDGDGAEFVLDMRYPGQRYDSASDLNYNYLRDGYESLTGRYTQSDPIGLYGGISTYLYADGAPPRNYDSDGLTARNSSDAKVDCSSESCASGKRRFNSRSEAARERLRAINPVSIHYNLEICGLVCKDQNSMYFISGNVVGTFNRCRPGQAMCPTCASTVAYWHSHGARMGKRDERFSEEDIGFANKYKIDGFLGTPSGQFWVYFDGNPAPIHRGEL